MNKEAITQLLFKNSNMDRHDFKEILKNNIKIAQKILYSSLAIRIKESLDNNNCECYAANGTVCEVVCCLDGNICLPCAINDGRISRNEAMAILKKVLEQHNQLEFEFGE